MFRKIFFTIFLATLLLVFQTLPQFEQAQAGEKGQPPELLGSYAVKEVHPGQTWNIYLKAKDVDGDMKYIVAVLFMAGEGSYPTSEIWLKGEHRSEFAGYIFLHTPMDGTLVADMDTLKVSIFIRDRAGNKSQTVKLPLSFVPGRTPEKIPAQWQQAAKHQLGYINNSILSTEDAEIR